MVLLFEDTTFLIDYLFVSINAAHFHDFNLQNLWLIYHAPAYLLTLHYHHLAHYLLISSVLETLEYGECPTWQPDSCFYHNYSHNLCPGIIYTPLTCGQLYKKKYLLTYFALPDLLEPACRHVNKSFGPSDSLNRRAARTPCRSGERSETSWECAPPSWLGAFDCARLIGGASANAFAKSPCSLRAPFVEPQNREQKCANYASKYGSNKA